MGSYGFFWFLVFPDSLGPLRFLGILGLLGFQVFLGSVGFAGFVGFVGFLRFVGFVGFAVYLRQPFAAVSSINHFRDGPCSWGPWGS